MIKDFATQHQLPRYRVQQFNKAYYQTQIDSYDQLTTWSKALRDQLSSQVPFMDLQMETEFISQRGDTIKTLFRLPTGQLIESVLMKHSDDRNTVCVSCMRGCPVNCDFCATGKLGFGGNLSVRQIIDQILYFNRKLKASHQKVTNVVFMGMGEPMLNLPNVLSAIETMTDPEKLGISKRRITISTSGYVPHFQKCIEAGFRGRVAISLHAPNQSLRAELMPVAKLFPLEQLMSVLDEYVKLTNKRVSYEYILINDINDQTKHAHQLGKLLASRLAHVNLIPYNPIQGRSYQRSTKDHIHRFGHILDKYQIPHSIRVTMGDDINAACGQLAANHQSSLIQSH